MVFWLGYPFAAIGEYCLLRALRASRHVSLIAVLILVCTPIVSTYSVGLKPEMWSACAMAGVAFWAVRLCNSTKILEGAQAVVQGSKRKAASTGSAAAAQSAMRECLRSAFLMGLFALITLNIRMTAVAILPLCLVFPLMVHAVPSRLQREKAVVAGLLTGLLLSGILIPLGFNFAKVP
jgi:hypothetical protein